MKSISEHQTVEFTEKPFEVGDQKRPWGRGARTDGDHAGKPLGPSLATAAETQDGLARQQTYGVYYSP